MSNHSRSGEPQAGSHDFVFAAYVHAGQMTKDEVARGSPYGATTIAGGDGSRQPTENEPAGARYQGRRITEIANKLHG